MAIKNRGGVWHYRFNLAGKEYSQTTHLAATRQNRTKAEVMELGHRNRLREGGRPLSRIVAREFNNAAKEFLEWVEVEHRQHPNSYRRVAVSLSSAKKFFGTEVASMIDEARIEKYKTWRIKEHKVRDITLRHDLHAISKFFRYAVKQRWARENPVRNVEIPSDADAVRMHILMPEEENHYFTMATKCPDLCDLGRLILNQGMRPDEVVCLRKEDVDLERGQLSISKGKSRAARRVLDLTSESRRILAKRMAAESPWIFPAVKNASRHVTRLNSAHDRLCAKALKAGIQLKFVLYDLRHTFATRLAQAGIDLATIAAILGHSSIRIVQRYVHPTADHKRNAMLRYDETLRAAAMKQAENAAQLRVN